MLLVDVVIVSARGSAELLRACLASVQANPLRSGTLTVTVVDNASRDGTVDLIRGLYPKVRVQELPNNRGFAHACNCGIRAGSAPYVLLLNPDTEVRPGALDRLVGVLNMHPEAAVVGPRLVGTDGQPDHNAKRSFPSVSAALMHFGASRIPGISRRLSGPSYARSDVGELQSSAVDAVSGSCMLVRDDAICDVGLMDEGYWMYGEDLDWCRRFAINGWEVRYEGAATVLHAKSGVTGRWRGLRTNWAFHRAMGRFYRRFEAGPRPALDVAVYLGVLLRFVIATVLATASRSSRALASRGGPAL